ncbi:MAG: hypothetical protein L0H41_09295 [Microlunatus sp.]|nr:hypothetical protein [Microlunatus sp.]MDN5770696.1 hypothetical protein [Microlunatus sp.]
MKFWHKVFGRGEEEAGEDTAIVLDQDVRRGQLIRLETALNRLAAEMRSCQSLDNPGWRVRVNEYNRLAGATMTLRRGEITREAVLDLVFEIRPLFSQSAPTGMEQLIPLQDEVVAAAAELRVLRPDERG